MTPTSLLHYVFYPNPGNVTYTSPAQGALLAISLALLALAVAIRIWRRRLSNPVTRKLSRSWSAVSLWFGIVGVVLVVSRVEQIQFIAMRFWWAVWIPALVAYVALQARLFRSRHYEVLPQVRVEDPRDKYLPGKKRR